MQYQSFTEAYIKHVKEEPDHIIFRFLEYKNGWQAQDITVRHLFKKSLEMAYALKKNRIHKGDRVVIFSMQDYPTIYAIYDERGYDFEITKTIDISKSGDNPIFTDASFTVRISSFAITKDEYPAEGADSMTVPATPASGDQPGYIELPVVDGTKIKIKGLRQGEYTVTESENDNFDLTAKIGRIVGGTPHTRAR